MLNLGKLYEGNGKSIEHYLIKSGFDQSLGFDDQEKNFVTLCADQTRSYKCSSAQIQSLFCRIFHMDGVISRYSALIVILFNENASRLGI